MKKTFLVIATNQEMLTLVKKVLELLEQAKHPWSGNSNSQVSSFRFQNIPYAQPVKFVCIYIDIQNQKYSKI